MRCTYTPNWSKTYLNEALESSLQSLFHQRIFFSRCDDVLERRRRSHKVLMDQCPMGFSECFDGICIQDNKICDGEQDCRTGEDEMDCVSRESLYGKVQKTIPSARMPHFSCPFLGSSSPLCPEGEVPCQDNVTCLSSDLVCNGVPNCPDSSDEPEGCLK